MTFGVSPVNASPPLTDSDEWVHAGLAYPNLLRMWSPNSLRLGMQCWQRFKLRRVEGWERKPREGAEDDVHRAFGSMWHECVEAYDRLRLTGSSHEYATDFIIAVALDQTWNHDTGQPWAGTVLSMWTCTGVEKTKSGRRKFLCDAARGERVYNGGPIAGSLADPIQHLCPRCGRAAVVRDVYIPTHATKHRLNLLRAVLAYCDDQATSGWRVADANGEPALEISYELDLPLLCPDGRPYVIRGVLDRISEFGDGGTGAVFPHERKTTTRALNRSYWAKFSIDPQIDTYDYAADRLYLGHEGIVIEALQVQAGGVRLARAITTRGPEQRAEWEDEMLGVIQEAEECARTGHWPRRISACATANDGQPCEFRDVCASAPSTRERMLEAGFVRRVREPIAGEIET